MVSYIFSDEVYRNLYGKPKGKRVWKFGNRDGSQAVAVGTEEKPLSYREAQKQVVNELVKIGFPIYKTVYLLV